MAVRTSGAEELEQRTQRELVRLARQRGIRGAYRMRKPELIAALRRAEAIEYADNLSVDGPADELAQEPRAQRRRGDRQRARRRTVLIGIAALAALTVLVLVLVLVLGGGGSGSGVGDTKSAGATTYKLLGVTTQDTIGSVRASDGSTFVVADIELTPPSGLRPFAPVSPATLVGGDGVTYEPSAEAAAALGSESLANQQVTPDTPARGKIAFSVPKAAAPGSKLILRDLGGSAQTTFDTGL
jgi:hypothetical protein